MNNELTMNEQATVTTKQATHTPGPWALQSLGGGYRGYDDWCPWCVRSPQNVHLATVGGVDRFESERIEANARLIAAAPELLEALEGIVDNEMCSCPAECDDQCWHSIARRAIAKATGGAL